MKVIRIEIQEEIKIYLSEDVSSSVTTSSAFRFFVVIIMAVTAPEKRSKRSSDNHGISNIIVY